MIVVGGVIPSDDYNAAHPAGAKAIFGPGNNIPEAAADLFGKLNAQFGYAPAVAAEQPANDNFARSLAGCQAVSGRLCSAAGRPTLFHALFISY